MAHGFLAGEIHLGGGAVFLLLVTEVEDEFLFGIELDDGRKRETLPGTEPLERAEGAGGNELFDLAAFHEAAGEELRHTEVATGALEAAVVFFDLAAALGAGGVQVAEVAGHLVALEGLGAFDDAPGHLGDVLHELRPGVATGFHLLELVLPLAGQLGLAQFFDAQTAQEGDEHEGFACRLKLVAIAMQVFFIDQAFDDGSAGSRGAQTAVGHRRAQFIVFDQFTGAFHRAEQRGFVVARGRFGLVDLEFDLLGLNPLAGLHRDQVGGGFFALVLGLSFAAVDLQPTGLHQHFAVGLEGFAFDPGDTSGDEVFCGRVEHGEEPLGHHVVNAQLHVAESLRFDRGGDDGEVIADLGVVEDALVGTHPALIQDGGGKLAVAAAVHGLQHASGGAEVVFGQGAGIGTRIGEHLVPLVQRLGDLQGACRGESEATVGLTLERGEVEQRGRELVAGLALLGHNARFALAAFLDGGRLGGIPNTVGPQGFVGVFAGRLGEALIEPAAHILTRLAPEGRMKFPIVARHELADLFLTLHQDGQRGGLHPTDGGLVEAASLGIEGGHHTGAVDADQPIGFGTAGGRCRQGLHFLVGTQSVETVADRGRCHGLQPQTSDRLPGLGVLGDVAEDEFALTAGVAGIDQCIDILALDELLQGLELGLGFLAGLEVEVRRNDRQSVETPLALFGLEGLRSADFEQVTDGRGDDGVVPFEVVIDPFEPTKGFGDVRGDGRFFGDDEGFSHERIGRDLYLSDQVPGKEFFW